MMMSDSVLTESNRSIELNALALKYLQDDQLTELAQFTVHKTKQEKQGQASLLRQVSLRITFRNYSLATLWCISSRIHFNICCRF